jgi:bacterioferritin (cytochrome b1)
MTVASQVKQSLATIKSVHASLKIYAEQSQNQEAGPVFNDAVQTTGEIIDDLEERLRILEFEEPQYKGL